MTLSRPGYSAPVHVPARAKQFGAILRSFRENHNEVVFVRTGVRSQTCLSSQIPRAVMKDWVLDHLHKLLFIFISHASKPVLGRDCSLPVRYRPGTRGMVVPNEMEVRFKEVGKKRCSKAIDGWRDAFIRVCACFLTMLLFLFLRKERSKRQKKKRPPWPSETYTR